MHGKYEREIAERSLYEKIEISVDGKNKNCGNRNENENGTRPKGVGV